MKQEVTRQCLGIDISKSSFQACLMFFYKNGQTKIRGSRKFKNSPAGFLELLKWSDKKIQSGSTLDQIFMEVTGVYHERLLHFLYDQKLPACLILGNRSKAFMKASGYRSKNDKIDAEGLALMACQMTQDTWKPVSNQIIEIRNLARLRNSLIDSRSAFKNRGHAMSYSARPTQQAIDCINDTIEDIDKRIDQLEEVMIELCKQDQEFFDKIKMIVASKPGVGLITVINVVSETNGFKEFRSIKQLESYAGFDIVENQSGKRYGKTRISKKGNSRLRACLYMPSMNIVKHKVEPYYNLYSRIRERNPGKGKGKIALVAVQRKMLGIIYTLWKKNEEFDLEYYKKQSQKYQLVKKEVVLA